MTEHSLFDDGYAIPDEAARLDDLERRYAEPIEEPESTALITVTALPQIQENLRALRERWEQYASDAEAMICTEDTVQTIKTMRAEMRKEFDEADTQRKAAKVAYMSPWNEVEATYKECVSDAFKAADATLKGKVDEFENEIKARCRERLELYFAELLAVEGGLDFLTFDRAMALGRLKIGMADATAKTPRKLMDALAEVVSRVACDLDRIGEMEDAAEIAAEYKERLDVASAVANVQGRKRRVIAEREAAEARRAEQERKAAAMAKVEAAAPAEAVEAPRTRDTRLFRITFTVNVTREQGIKLRDYLKQEGIDYE